MERDLDDYARKTVPGITFSSDIIVGFPGETEEDFVKTLELVRKVGYMQPVSYTNLVETGEQADAHLKLLALRQSRAEYVSSLLQIPTEELTLGGRKALARWYEVYGYDDAMVQEAAIQAGPKRCLLYTSCIMGESSAMVFPLSLVWFRQPVCGL